MLTILFTLTLSLHAQDSKYDPVEQRFAFCQAWFPEIATVSVARLNGQVADASIIREKAEWHTKNLRECLDTVSSWATRLEFESLKNVRTAQALRSTARDMYVIVAEIEARPGFAARLWKRLRDATGTAGK